MQAVEKGLEVIQESMACYRRLMNQRIAWGSYTFKLLQAMLAASEPSAPLSPTNAIIQASSTVASSASDSPAADCMSQSSQAGLAEQNIPAPPSSSTTHGSPPIPVVKTEGASDTQEGSRSRCQETPAAAPAMGPVKTDTDSSMQEPSKSCLDKDTAPPPAVAPVVSMARLQQLAGALKLSAGPEHFKLADAEMKARLDGDDGQGGATGAGQEDCTGVAPSVSLHLTQQMPDPRVVDAAGRLLHGAELNAESVKQFFLQVRSVGHVPW